MTNFHIYSFILAALPLLLGFLFIWFGKNYGTTQLKKMKNISSVTQDIPHYV